MGELYFVIAAILIYVVVKYLKRKIKEIEEIEKKQAQEAARQERLKVERLQQQRFQHELFNGALIEKCRKILDAYSKVVQNERFGTPSFTKICFCKSNTQVTRAAIKLVVERYSGDIDGLIKGYIPNPDYDPEKYNARFITLNHGNMYHYLFNLGFPHDFGMNFDLNPCEDRDYAEWVINIYGEADILYDKTHWLRFDAAEQLVEKLSKEYPALRLYLDVH